MGKPGKSGKPIGVPENLGKLGGGKFFGRTSFPKWVNRVLCARNETEILHWYSIQILGCESKYRTFSILWGGSASRVSLPQNVNSKCCGEAETPLPMMRGCARFQLNFHSYHD